MLSLMTLLLNAFLKHAEWTDYAGHVAECMRSLALSTQSLKHVNLPKQ